MSITVSITDLRKNISTYLDRVSQGVNVVVRDEKRNMDVAQIIGTNTFNKSEYEKVLRTSAGIFGDKYNMWGNQKSITSWLNDSREQSERIFS